jgi:hypothetical protein
MLARTPSFRTGVGAVPLNSMMSSSLQRHLNLHIVGACRVESRVLKVYI